MSKKALIVGPRESAFQKAAEYAVALARLMRFGMPRIGRKRMIASTRNLEQECARRRRFHKYYGTAIGGGPVHER